MARLREADRGRIEELEGALLQLRLDGHFELERLLHQMRDLLGAEETAAWGAVREADRYRLVFSYVSNGHLHRAAARVERGAGAEEEAEEDLDRLGATLRPWMPAGKKELRLVLCASASNVAWVGAFQGEDFTARQQAILKALLPAFRRRLLAERVLQDAETAEAGLLVALAAIPRPAFIVDAAGRARHMNSGARALVASAREHERVAVELRTATLAAALRQTHAALDVTRINSTGQPHYLAVYRDDGSDVGLRVASAAARWSLTRRQVDVLRRVVNGEANKVIAAALGRAESTVELHVTQIFRRAGVDNRAALVARFWGLR